MNERLSRALGLVCEVTFCCVDNVRHSYPRSAFSISNSFYYFVKNDLIVMILNTIRTFLLGNRHDHTKLFSSNCVNIHIPLVTV